MKILFLTSLALTGFLLATVLGACLGQIADLGWTAWSVQISKELASLI